MDYLLVKNSAYSAPVRGVWGIGTISYWLVVVGVDSICKYVINAMSANQALQIAEEILCLPVTNYYVLADGNIKIEFSINRMDYYLFTNG